MKLEENKNSKNLQLNNSTLSKNNFNSTDKIAKSTPNNKETKMSNNVDINKLLDERNIKNNSTALKSWNEVSFRIKLTELEYKELMKEKSKNVKI